jgi:hypothetical protein
MEEEDWDFSSRSPPFPDATKTNSDFYRRNLQAFQDLKAKSNPKQAHPKCKCNSSSSITQQKITQLHITRNQSRSKGKYFNSTHHRTQITLNGIQE